MFHLYHFHLALLPPRIVEVDMPTIHNSHPLQVSLRITRPSAPTPQPSPSGSPKERKKIEPSKKVNLEKGKEKELVDLEGRRRFGGLQKMNAK